MNMPEMNGTNFLIAGAGGGFDVYGGLPLTYELLRANANVVMASFSLRSQGFGVRESTPEDYPEGELTNIGVPVYTFGKNGVQGLHSAYAEIIVKHKIDSIILVDGGVDSLMVGDEVSAGTVLEDSISLAAVSRLGVAHKYVACLGFGTEIEEDLNHYRVLENISSLIKAKAMVGGCALTSSMEAYKVYEQACQVAWTKGRKSHIHSRIIPAVQGEFGNFRVSGVESNVKASSNKPLFVSPLSTFYWFFHLQAVVDQSKIIPVIQNSKTFTDAMMLFRQNLIQPTRSKETIPL